MPCNNNVEKLLFRNDCSANTSDQPEGKGEGGGLGARGCAETVKGDGEMGLYAVANVCA